MNAPVLPPLCDAVLDRATLEQLFTDLAGCTEVLSVLEKAGDRQYASPRSLTLHEARQRLVAGAVRAVQVRYLYRGHEWCDTLLNGPAGFRVVRCQVPTAPDERGGTQHAR